MIASIYLLFYYKIDAFGGDGNDWDSQTEALLDSESEIVENKE